MILLIYLLNMCFLSQVINASKSENNIVMSGGGGGCKDSGALIMQSGEKGRPFTNFESFGSRFCSSEFSLAN